ncbi:MULTISPECIES: tyrosine-type recombinase/integrase [unclassified Aeromicrobium]|uniref:tyrosine-type recombinase/integrase n=1 Tax=unclassified Aeromicrobium TaxID=2633570 RepID=UPI00288BF5FF|nr:MULTISPECIES: tyrosine-type recombinase/integrase [unclassified Aeromicrobium]
MSSPEQRVASRLHHARVRSFLRDGEADPDRDSHEQRDPLTALIERTATIYQQAIRDDTRSTYARRWLKFERWCDAHGFTPLPAPAETLMLFLAGMIDGDEVTSLNTLRGYAAAVGRVHREAGHAAPNDSPLLRQFMRGLARHTEVRPPIPVQTGALRIGDIRTIMRLLETLGVDVRAVRDAAVLALHSRGLSDGEIARLTWSDVDFGASDLRVLVKSIRTGSENRLHRLPAAGGDSLAAECLLMWRSLMGEGEGPLFSAVDSSGASAGRPMAHRTVSKSRRSRLQSLAREGECEASLDTAIRILRGPPSEVLRDRALLLLGFAMAGRRGEVVGLRWSDIVQRSKGLVVHIRSSKTDLSGRGVDLGVPAGLSMLTDPVGAVEAWRERVALQRGAAAADGENWVFPQLGRAGRISDSPLSPEGLTVLVRRRAEAAGVTGRMGGRSLRAGFITTAAELNIPIDRIAEQSRHKTMDSLALYVRTTDPTIRSAAGEVGL